MRHESLKKAGAVLRRAMSRGDFKSTPEGVLFPHQGLLASGHYQEWVNGQYMGESRNLIPDAAILSILNVYWGSTAKLSAWYLALFSGAVDPTADLTAANFASTMTEITSTSQGYSEATRPQWSPSAAAAGQIDNLAAKAAFTIVCSSSITVQGAALLSNNTRGGTSGVLSSCSRFTTPRVLQNGDNYALGYYAKLLSS